MPPPASVRRPTLPKVASAAAIVLAGTLAVAFHVASVLGDPDLSAGIVSRGLWQRTVLGLGGEIFRNAGIEVAEVPIVSLAVPVAGLSILAWLTRRRLGFCARQISYPGALYVWGRNGWLWWLVALVWEILAFASELARSPSSQALCQATLPIWHSMLWAGWLTTFVMLVRRPAAAVFRQENSDRIPRVVWVAMAVYFMCFAAMNWLFCTMRC